MMKGSFAAALHCYIPGGDMMIKFSLFCFFCGAIELFLRKKDYLCTNDNIKQFKFPI